MEIINEHQIGICKGTDLEKAVQANFNGECQEGECILQWQDWLKEKGCQK